MLRSRRGLINLGLAADSPGAAILLGVLKNASWLSASQLAVALLSFGTTTYLARVLAPPSFGAWQVAAALGAFLAVLAGIGLSPYGVWRVARDPSVAKGIARSFIGLRTGLCAIFFVLWLVVTALVPVSNEGRVLLVGAVAGYMLRSLWPDWVYQGLGRGVGLAIATATHPLVWLILLALFVAGPTDLALVPATFFLTAACFGAAFWFYVWRTVPASADLHEGRMAILRAAAPLGIATVMVQLLVNMDYVLVGVLASRFETAQYAAAYRVMLLVQGFGVAFHAAVLPTLTNQLSREGQASTLLRSLLTILFATVLPVSIVIGALAPELVLTIYGQAYAAAGPVLSVLAWQIPIEVVGTLYANMLIAQGRHRRYAAILGLGAALKFLLILALAPAFGALGVAFASVIALSVVVVSALMQARLAISIDPRAVVAIGSGMALLLVFLRLSGGAPMPLQIILGAIAYVGGCAASVALLALRVWPRGSTP